MKNSKYNNIMEKIIQWAPTDIVWLSYQYGEILRNKFRRFNLKNVGKNDLIRDLQHQFVTGKFYTITS